MLARVLSAYDRYERLLDIHPLATQRIVIDLRGDGKPADLPTVDPATGEIVLFRYRSPGGEYEASVAHELIHALRRSLWTDPKRQTDAFLFLEEGFAEVLATEAGFPSSGFPTFGAPVAVAAGAWIETGQDLPIVALIRHHKALNLRCVAQAHALRVSFVTYLRERFGLATLIRVAYSDSPLDADGLASAFGADLEKLASDWRAWARKGFEALAGAREKAKAYRQRTPIRALPVCNQDVVPVP